MAGESDNPTAAGRDDGAAFRALLGPARLGYFSQLTDQPVLADRKATFILTAAGMIVTVLLFFLEAIAAVLHAGRLWKSVPLTALLLVLAMLLAVAVRSAYAAYVMLLPPMPRSLAFFRHVADESLDRYAADMAALDHGQALDAMLHYNYSVAVTAAAKFRLVGRALKCMRTAIPLWMLILLLLAVWR